MRKAVNKQIFIIFGLLLNVRAFASSYNIGTGGGSAFDKITSMLQDWVDFMSGPFGKFVVIGSLVIAAIVWAAAPKSGPLAYCIRAIVAGAVLLNIGTWMGWLGG